MENKDYYSKLPLTNKKVIVVTDIHGNLDDFKYYLDLWLQNTSDYIIFTGDLIHADTLEEDYSLEILDLVVEYIGDPHFIVLLGNHEWAQLEGSDAYKYGVNQVESFKKLVEDKYPDDYTCKYTYYLNILKKFKYFAVTSNGFFIIHGGIHEDYIDSIVNRDVDIYDLDIFKRRYEYDFLTECLWARQYDDFTEDSIRKFLDCTGLDYIISGHTVNNGCHIIGDQLIFDSSYNTENKYFLLLYLDSYYRSIVHVLKRLFPMK